MADDLLDLELDTMILSQSTRSNMVSRVPYKKMRDSQTSNSRLSPELCCKDQYRSSNNSALSDDTRSPISPGMPPLEMVWDTEPTPASQPSKALPTTLLNQTCWITKATETQIAYHPGDEDGTTCRLCQQHFTTPRRLRVHLPQHFITTFYPYGEYSYHRDNGLLRWTLIRRRRNLLLKIPRTDSTLHHRPRPLRAPCSRFPSL